MYLYAIMDIEHSGFLKAFFNGNGACYNDDKCLLVGLTEEHISTFDGDIVRVDAMELTDAQLTALTDQMITEAPTGRLIIVSIAQGKYLYKTHPAFKPQVL